VTLFAALSEAILALVASSFAIFAVVAIYSLFCLLNSDF
jgi:hypothetical protein